MGAVFKVDVQIPPAITGLVRRLAVTSQGEMVSQMGRDVACRLGRFFSDASRSRHKVAERFGVKPTGVLEFTDTYPPRSHGGGEITSRRSGSTATLRVTGIPFLGRVYGSVKIVPRRASCLTIPINRASVHKSAAEMESIGYVLFSRRSKRGGRASGVLYGKREGSKRAIPLFALVKSVTLPQDRGLMPTERRIGSWAASSARRFLGL